MGMWLWEVVLSRFVLQYSVAIVYVVDWVDWVD